MDNHDIYGIYGASGFGHSVLMSAREQLVAAGVPTERLVLIDDKPESDHFHGHRLLNYDQFLDESADTRRVIISIANSKVRENIAMRCELDGIGFWNVKAPNAVIREESNIKDGAIVNSFSLISNDSRIGKHFHLNLYSFVGHDCIIGDYVTFGPRVSCNGYTIIEDHVYIGTGAILRNGTPKKPLHIGKGAVIGMGAVVTKNVDTGMTVVGNPARPLVR